MTLKLIAKDKHVLGNNISMPFQLSEAKEQPIQFDMTYLRLTCAPWGSVSATPPGIKGIQLVPIDHLITRAPLDVLQSRELQWQRGGEDGGRGEGDDGDMVVLVSVVTWRGWRRYGGDDEMKVVVAWSDVGVVRGAMMAFVVG
ncbi:hypothetical protein Tco_0564082 [Tanacetum coccineum]